MTKKPKNRVDAEDQAKLGAYLADRHEYTQAEMRFKIAVEIEPNAARYRFLLGMCLSAQGHHTEAEHHFRKTVELCPNIKGYRAILHKCLRAQGKIGE